jgi:hypothetical protein
MGLGFDKFTDPYTRWSRRRTKSRQGNLPSPFLLFSALYSLLTGHKINIRRLQLGIAQEARLDFHAETALKLATCDGPPYYYKVAYEEAERMLEKLK